ncbi:ATP-grasp domain-containing protein [Yoonia sp. 2307UL14-13]|uniref:ATP-grasp domain-containing protein n=1 Tax=Yoonia sp. 2307UL14-13 TaxID=3126506 RepID=UPI003098E5CE
MARLLSAAGCHVVMADSLRHALGFASGVHQGTVRLPPFNADPPVLAHVMQAVIDDHAITHVLPTCEEVIYLARLWEVHRMNATLIAPDAATLLSAHNKYQFIEMARAAGVAVPRTWLMQSGDDPDEPNLPSTALVYKPVWSRFGERVLIRPRRITFRPSTQSPWVAQEYLHGDLCCAYAVADAGKISACAIYHPLYPAGQGGGTAFAPLDAPDIADAVAAFAAYHRWTGQLSFDVIRTETGPFFIECNPRATSGLHLFENGVSFADALFGQGQAMPVTVGLYGVRLAMALYGVRWGRLRALWHDLRRAQDVIAWQGDRVSASRQLRAFAEIAGIAVRHRISLQTASTYDIAWNGSEAETP